MEATSTQAGTVRRGDQPAASVWGAGVRAMVPVPPEHRQLEADATAVRATLRCSEEDLEALRRSGIVWVERGGVQLFDPIDVYNVGLLSGSGRTVPEVASSYFSQLADAGYEAWTAPARTEVNVDRADEGSGELVGELGCLRFPARDAAGRQTATYMPHPAVEVPVSSRLTSLFDDILADFSFQLLPDSLKEDADAIAALGVGDCHGLSLVLAGRCAEAGFAAVVERGFIRGRFGWGAHAWVRVEDEDDRPKVLDPTLPLVAASQGADAGGFSRFCCGRLVTRVVPRALRLDGRPPVHLSLPDATPIGP